MYFLFLYEGYRKFWFLNKVRVYLYNVNVFVICNEKIKGENDIIIIVEYYSICSKNIVVVLGSLIV